MVIIDGAGINCFSLQQYLKIKWYKFFKILVKKKLIKEKVLKKYGSTDYKVLNETQKSTFRNIINSDLKKYLKFVNVRTTLIWGKRDKSTPLKHAKIMNKNIKNSTLIVYPKAGHFSFLDCRWDFQRDIENHFYNAKK